MAEENTDNTQVRESAAKTAAPAKEESKAKLSRKSEEIIKAVETMTVLELADLVKALEDKFGVSAAAPVAVMAGAPGTAAAQSAASQEEEKASFSVVLASAGANKIQVIKELRAVTTLGLKEAKDLVESAPKTIKEGAPKEEAEKIKKQLEAAGAKVELK